MHWNEKYITKDWQRKLTATKLALMCFSRILVPLRMQPQKIKLSFPCFKQMCVCAIIFPWFEHMYVESQAQCTSRIQFRTSSLHPMYKTVHVRKPKLCSQCSLLFQSPCFSVWIHAPNVRSCKRLKMPRDEVSWAQRMRMWHPVGNNKSQLESCTSIHGTAQFYIMSRRILHI